MFQDATELMGDDAADSLQRDLALSPPDQSVPEDEVPASVGSGRHAAPKPDESESGWPKAAALIGVGLLVASVALSTVFPFNTPVQDMQRAGLIITALMLLAVVGFTASAVSAWRHQELWVVCVDTLLAAVTCTNWCAWQYSFNVVEFVRSLL